MKILIITGPPYSGKGTQCEILRQRLGFMHISTGDRCRQEKADRTDIGLTLSEYEEKGDLVPDSLMKELFSRILDENSQRPGIVLDGYPRTKPQVDDLIELVRTKNLEISCVINIDVPKEELLTRATKRALASDRKDDQDPAIHLKRVQVFEESTRPAIGYMTTLMPVTLIDGMGNVDEVTDRVMRAIGN